MVQRGHHPCHPYSMWWSQIEKSCFETSSIRTAHGLLVNDIPLSVQILEPEERWAREDRQMGIKKKAGTKIEETDEKTWL